MNNKKLPACKDSTYEHPALGDDDYIRRWIARTEQDAHSDNTRPKIDRPQRRPGGNLQETQLYRSFPQAALNIEVSRSRKRRRHTSSSDSSFLEPAEAGAAAKLIHSPIKHRAAGKKEDHIPSKHIQHKPKPPASESSKHSKYPEEAFERKPRHKTREDLYEPKKKDSGIYPTEKLIKKKPEKKGDRRKVAKKGGTDLMNNFSSKSIAQDRLTMRVSHGLGLFKNGRASSPAMRRGLPDLAFSEMEFLQRPTHSRSDSKEKIGSKSRDREKGKTEKAYQEISSFFQPKRVLEGTSSNSCTERSSIYMNEDKPVHYPENLCFRKAQAQLRVFEDIENRSRGFDQPRPYPGSSTPITHPHSAKLRTNVLNTGSLLSGKATTCMTWSESQVSPLPTVAMRLDRLQQSSPVPDHVRKLIEQTEVSPVTFCRRLQELNSTTTSNSTSETETSIKNKAWKQNNLQPRTQIPIQEKTASMTRSNDNPGDTLHMADVDKRLSGGTNIDVPVRVTKQIVVKQDDLELGPRQRQTTTTPTIPDALRATSASGTSPISRVQLAEKARIKRPLMTQPIVRDARRGTIDASQRQGDGRQSDSQSTADAPTWIGPPTDKWPTTRSPTKPMKANEAFMVEESTEDCSLLRLNANGSRHSDDQDEQQPHTHVGSEPYINYFTHSQDHASRINSSTNKVGILDLPRRVSWVGQNKYYIPPGRRLSPILETTPLYFHQMQQNNNSEVTIDLFARLDDDSEDVKCFDQGNTYVMRSPEVPGYGLISDGLGATDINVDSNGQHDHDSDFENVGDSRHDLHMSDTTLDLEALQNMDNYSLEALDSNELSYGVDCPSFYDAGKCLHSYANFRINGGVEGCKGQGNDPMQGFWRSRRLY